MPEKNKEKKTKDVLQKVGTGGAQIFIPQKKKVNKRIRYPKEYDPMKAPDPERWLPKWQRSRFKKMAKKKGIYLKGAQGDAQIDTDVTSGNLKSTAHQDAAAAGNKRRKKK
jgi:signal recognition particle subunit SRP72